MPVGRSTGYNRIKRTEFEYFIDADGNQYPLILTSGDRDVLSDEGSGMPPIEYITERGPFQHGESLRDYFLRPRIVQYLVRQNFCSRAAAWEGRNTLLAALRPNRLAGVTGVIRKVLGDGTRRDLVVAPLEGPRFEPRRLGGWDEWSIQEVLRFIAHNPVYYDPTEQSLAFVSPDALGFPYTFPFPLTDATGFVYPITFPVTFGQFGGGGVWDLDYLGTWDEYPTIVAVGPFSFIKLENLTTDEQITFMYDAAAGSTVTFALTYGAKGVTLQDGTNLIANISADSDLAQFHFTPGINQLQITVYGFSSATTVTIQYKHRYIGI